MKNGSRMGGTWKCKLVLDGTVKYEIDECSKESRHGVKE